MTEVNTADRMQGLALGLTERLAGKVTPFKFGRVIEDPDLPDVWDSNFLLVDVPAADAAALDDAADALQSPLAHRKIIVFDPEVATALRPGLEAAGYTTARLVWMEFVGDVVTDIPEAELIDLIDAESCLRSFFLSTLGEKVMEVGEQLIERSRRLDKVTDVRRFGVKADGEVVSMCDLYVEDDVAQVEDVKTLEAFRKRGFARRVVNTAVIHARRLGAGLVFLIADADDWPAGLYRRMGFEDRAFTFEFSKPVD